MLDTFYPALVSFVTIALGLAPGLWPDRFKKRPYQITAVICAILLGIGTYAVMDRDRRKAAVEREEVIQETSVRVSADLTKQYANTVSTQAQKIGELEGFIQSQGKDVRDVKKYTVASTTEIHALFEQNQTGKQKRQEVKDQLNRYVGMNNSARGRCRTVSSPGRGGISPENCIDSAREWISMATGYISGSLGELYLNRFYQAGSRHNGDPPAIGIDPNLDPYIRAELARTMYELEAKANVIEEFIKELGQ
jgi:hypothetical protein